MLLDAETTPIVSLAFAQSALMRQVFKIIKKNQLIWSGRLPSYREHIYLLSKSLNKTGTIYSFPKSNILYLKTITIGVLKKNIGNV